MTIANAFAQDAPFVASNVSAVGDRLRIALPDPSVVVDQDREYCVLERNGSWREVRFHDYAQIFSVPGLYERLFHKVLQCNSPKVVVDSLAHVLREERRDPASLRVLDLGAGNGLVGEELRSVGISRIVGVDILPEAREAAMRDRPGVYEDYLIADLTVPDAGRREALDMFDGLVCVAALGFGDIPVAAFAEAFRALRPQGFLAFNIKETFMNALDPSGFDAFIKGMVASGTIRVHAQQRYRHRLATSGEPLYYYAVIASKTAEIPAALVS